MFIYKWQQYHLHFLSCGAVIFLVQDGRFSESFFGNNLQ